MSSAPGFSGDGAPAVVPANTVWVIREICVTLGFAITPPESLWWIQIGDEKYYLPALPEAVLSNPTTYTWEGRIVMLPGEELTVHAIGITVDYRITGYALGQ